MLGEEFLGVAARLSASSREADVRSSVSRAYYGAFHVAAQFLEDCGVRLPRSAAAHEKLRYCLQASGDGAVIGAANRLDSLRSARNRADYDLANSSFGSSAKAVLQLAIAQAVVDEIAGFSDAPNNAALRSAIRSYASSVLRLPVSE